MSCPFAHAQSLRVGDLTDFFVNDRSGYKLGRVDYAQHSALHIRFLEGGKWFSVSFPNNSTHLKAPLTAARACNPEQAEEMMEFMVAEQQENAAYPTCRAVKQQRKRIKQLETQLAAAAQSSAQKQAELEQRIASLDSALRDSCDQLLAQQEQNRALQCQLQSAAAASESTQSALLSRCSAPARGDDDRQPRTARLSTGVDAAAIAVAVQLSRSSLAVRSAAAAACITAATHAHARGTRAIGAS